LRHGKTLLAKRIRPSLGGLLIGIVLLLNLLIAAPALHEIFHADAGQAGHQCAVTLLAHGKVDSAIVEIHFAAPSAFVESVSLAEFSVFSPAIENLPAERAPPASVSSLV